MTVVFAFHKSEIEGTLKIETQTLLFVGCYLFIYLFRMVLAKPYSKFNTDSEYVIRKY